VAELASDEDLEPTANQLLAQIYSIVSRIESRLADMEERQKGMEARQVAIKEDIKDQPVVGSFASTDQK
jgi:hypothetical protein